MPQRTMTRSGVVCAGMLLVVWLYCTARVWFPGFPMKVWLFEVTTWVVGARLSLRLWSLLMRRLLKYPTKTFCLLRGAMTAASYWGG